MSYYIADCLVQYKQDDSGRWIVVDAGIAGNLYEPKNDSKDANKSQYQHVVSDSKDDGSHREGDDRNEDPD